MSVQEMLDWFDILQDKYASPYFDDSEKLTFLNRATYDFIGQYFPENDAGVNFELDSNTEQKISTLIYELDPVNMDSSGVVNKSTLVTDVRTKSGDTQAQLYKVISVEFYKAGKRYPCKSIRHNDKGAFEDNYFKRPSYKAPKYLFQNSVLQFRPIDTYADIYITVIKTPVTLALSPSPVSSDLPPDTHNEIVARAIEFAGIASREQVLGEISKKFKG